MARPLSILCLAVLVGALAVGPTSAQFNFGFRPTTVTGQVTKFASSAQAWTAVESGRLQRALAAGFNAANTGNAIQQVMSLYRLGTSARPVTLFLPSNLSLRNVTNLGAIIRNNAIIGAWTPQQLANLRPGTVLKAWNNASPIVKASAKGAGVVLARNLYKQNYVTRISRFLYRTNNLVIYGVDSLFQPKPR